MQSTPANHHWQGKLVLNPSSGENLVMTSQYQSPLSVQTLGEREGCLNVTCDVSSINMFHILLEVTFTSKLCLTKTSAHSQQEWYYRVKYKDSTVELRF